MRKNFSFLILCIFILSACSQKQLLTEDEIRIGVIGDVERFEYANVVYEQLDVEEILTNDTLKSDYHFLLIADEHFKTVSSSEYVERFGLLKFTVLFADSTKGWIPFISPLTLDLPKIYDDYNDSPKKQSIVSVYELPAAFTGMSVEYSHDETLSQEDFEELVEYIFR